MNNNLAKMVLNSIFSQKKYVFILCTLFFLLNIAYYYPFLSDDSLISLRYAERFLQGKGLTWTDGEFVEGYSNLLWILVVSFLGFFKIELIFAARLLGTIFSLVTAYLLLEYGWQQKTSAQYRIFLTLFLLCFCGTAPVVVWAIGGLEQPLYMMLLAFSLYFGFLCAKNSEILPKHLVFISLALGFLSITRPDGALFTALTLLFFLFFFWKKGISWQKNLQYLFIIGSFTGLLCGGQLLFRMYYYSAFVPNTALVKVKPSFHHAFSGIKYWVHSLLSLNVFFFAFLWIIKQQIRTQIRPILSWVFLLFVAWSVYLILIGGDIFPAFRHGIPFIILIFFFLIAKIPNHFPQIFEHKKYLTYFALLAPIYLFSQFLDYANHRAKTERWEWEGKVLAENLGKVYQNKMPLVAVTSAGCIPYWSKLPSLDMLGLTDTFIAKHPPKDFGKGILAHELGDAEYVLRRNPDIIVFGIGDLPVFSENIKMVNLPIFAQRYHQVWIDLPSENDTCMMYVNFDSPKTGYQYSDSSLTIQALFFSDAKAKASFKENTLFTSLRPNDSLSLKIKLKKPFGKNSKINILPQTSSLVAQFHFQEKDSLLITLKNISDQSASFEKIIIKN